ncbi:uncharacterized protein N7511_009432 [Penicillium nucicola]|uniref:uncharacterized protein n=1 Tax=Penicillium nucicola TaxID=1850975 RepID=UPI002544FA60|nr:uncharacterized protein N7511_009432 [Penicillium nucicola]KAJ5747736.1 hypothetical protein N7511_009432 [Penicillium nucicola]
MRFLCLHGVGTNSKVLEIQTAPLRYEIGDGHTYDFVEGIFPYELAPEIRDLVVADDQGFSYFDPHSVSASLQAVNDLERFIEEEGPYDGVLGFSQGMMLACTLLMRKVQEKKALPFKCAIFFSPRMAPLDYVDLGRGKFTEINPLDIIDKIRIPTALVWGSVDPHAAKAIELQQLFPPEILSTVVHDGGHEIPGYAFKDALAETVKVIRRTTDEAGRTFCT